MSVNFWLFQSFIYEFSLSSGLTSLFEQALSIRPTIRRDNPNNSFRKIVTSYIKYKVKQRHLLDKRSHSVYFIQNGFKFYFLFFHMICYDIVYALDFIIINNVVPNTTYCFASSFNFYVLKIGRA